MNIMMTGTGLRMERRQNDSGYSKKGENWREGKLNPKCYTVKVMVSGSIYNGKIVNQPKYG
jgi:hypothetical protein